MSPQILEAGGEDRLPGQTSTDQVVSLTGAGSDIGDQGVTKERISHGGDVIALDKDGGRIGTQRCHLSPIVNVIRPVDDVHRGLAHRTKNIGPLLREWCGAVSRRAGWRGERAIHQAMIGHSGGGA